MAASCAIKRMIGDIRAVREVSITLVFRTIVLSPSPSHNADKAGVCVRLSSNKREYQREMTVGGQERGAARTPPSREATPSPRRVEFERLPRLILERLESPGGARAGRGSGRARHA